MKKSSFLIAGKHAVTEALRNSNRKVLRVFLTEDSKKKLNKDNENLELLRDIKMDAMYCLDEKDLLQDGCNPTCQDKFSLQVKD